MFEAYLRDLITTVLGNYFEGIDATPLEVSFWRGDVVLRNVKVRSTVFTDFYMPFKIIAGRIGTVTLKVPWTQIYTASVEATMKDFHLIVSPCQTAPYNPEEEERYDYITKMQLVEEIETKRRTAQLAAGNRDAPSTSNNVNLASAQFRESLIMLLLKNLHLRVDGLHIRYEDAISNPMVPFAFGIALNTLHMRTTDSAWNPIRTSEEAGVPVHTFYKHLSLQGLAVYLNSDGNLFGTKYEEKGEMLDALKNFIRSQMHTLKYLIGPITTELKLKITPNPDALPTPFSSPKGSVEISMNQLTLGISNLQFQNLLYLVETIEFMARGRRYRKYRPAVTSYAGNYPLWWQFAYDCVVSEIRQKRHGWDYNNIKNHRELSQRYCESYYQKVVLHNNSSAIKENLIACEKELDVFNIVYLRAKVQIKKESVDQLEMENRKRYGWLSTILGWNAAEMAAEFESKLRDSLTEEEKRKLNQAVGFSESSLPTIYPSDYVGYTFYFTVDTLSTFITDYASTKETIGKQLIKLTVKNVDAKFQFRPGISGSNFNASVGSVEADTVETSVSSESSILKTRKLQPGENVIEFEWELRPYNSIGSKRITVITRAMEIIYNSKTLQQIRSCFSLPKEIQLQALRYNAKTRLNEYKENFSIYLQEWIQKSYEGQLILRVEVDAPYFIIPENGELEERSNCVIIDFGEVKVQSRIQNPEDTNDETTEHVVANLTNMKVVMVLPGLENGVLLPIRKRPHTASTVASSHSLNESIIEAMISAIHVDRKSEDDETESTLNSTRIVNLMDPVQVSATITKSGLENIVNTRISDISLRFNPISAELFRRISKSWNDLDFEMGIKRLSEDVAFMQTFYDRSSPYVQNSAIHSYLRQVDEGQYLLNNLKTGKENLALDKYICHALIGNPAATCLLVTTVRVFYLSFTDIHGKATVIWEHAYEDFTEPPKVTEQVEGGIGITFTVKDPTKGATERQSSQSMSSVRSESSTLYVSMDEPPICNWVLSKICDALAQYRLVRTCDEATTSYTG